MNLSISAEPSRADIEAHRGPAVVEFGSANCGICRAAQPSIEAARAAHPALLHTKVEDGRGRPLGRAYGVKLWPTLVFLMDGQELSRLVRPTPQRVAEAFDHLAARAADSAPNR